MLDVMHEVRGELQDEGSEMREVCDYCEHKKPCRMFVPESSRTYYDICKTCVKKYLRE